MLKKQYGLVFIKGRWYVKNYGRVLKNGNGLRYLGAKYLAWSQNRRHETPIIELTRIVARPGPPEDYEPQHIDIQGTPLEPGDLVAFRNSSPLIKVTLDETHKIDFKAPSAPCDESGVQPPHPLPENEGGPPPFEDFRVTDGKHLLPSEHDMGVLRRMGKLDRK